MTSQNATPCHTGSWRAPPYRLLVIVRSWVRVPPPAPPNYLFNANIGGTAHPCASLYPTPSSTRSPTTGRRCGPACASGGRGCGSCAPTPAGTPAARSSTHATFHGNKRAAERTLARTWPRSTAKASGRAGPVQTRRRWRWRCASLRPSSPAPRAPAALASAGGSARRRRAVGLLRDAVRPGAAHGARRAAHRMGAHSP